jgi:WD40 repeat protein
MARPARNAPRPDAGSQRANACSAARTSLLACSAALLFTGAAAAQPRESWEDQPADIRGLALSPDGKTLASLSLSGGKGGVKLWDLATKKEKGTLVCDQKDAGSLVGFTPDGKALVAVGIRPPKAGEKESVFPLTSAKVWDVTTQKLRLTIDFPEGGTAGGVITADSKYLIAGGPNTGVVFYDLETGKPSETIEMKDDPRDFNAMALAPDGKTLALGTQTGLILLLDLKEKKVRATISAHMRRVETLGFSPDGKALASTSREGGKAELWDARSGEHLDALDVGLSMNGVEAVAFSPDSKTVALAGRGLRMVVLWDRPGIGERDDFEGVGPKLDIARCAVFTGDGKTLITGGRDKAIRFWDVPQGKPRGFRPRE